MRRLGHFEIRDRLGEGGMGVVHHAVDRRDEGVVALKVMHPQFEHDEQRRARFLREARYAQAVGHPGVVEVRDLGEVHLDNGHRTLYLAMELVSGRELLQIVSRRAPGQRWVLDVARAVTEALDAVHASGTVHRDVKPANLLVTPEGRVKLIDFGLALRVGDDPTGHLDGLDVVASSPVRTQAGTLVGTLGYAPPEQLRGEPLDHRADLYALGATVYQMLTGGLPFSGDNANEVLASMERAGREGLWSRLGASAPGASPRLAALVCDLMAPRAEDRPASAGLVIQALEHLVADPDVDRPLEEASQPGAGHRRPWTWRRLTEWWRS